MLEMHDCTKGEEVLHGRQWKRGEIGMIYFSRLYIMFDTLLQGTIGKTFLPCQM